MRTQALQNTLLNTPTNRQAVLQATGLVWSAVSGLTEHCSATSQAAYAKAFKNTQDTISDAHAELRDLIDSGASDSDSPEAHPPPPLDEEEETDELDNILNSLAPTAPLAEKEEERIKGLSVLIRLARLLFKRVAAFTLASSSDDQQLERLWKNGEELSEMVDDIVMAAQPEQDLDELKRLLRSLKEACERLANHPAEQEELSDALQSLKVGETKKASTDEERKWRSMAVAQIQKAADQILAI